MARIWSFGELPLHLPTGHQIDPHGAFTSELRRFCAVTEDLVPILG